MPSNQPRLIFDLFAGCGGLSLGLEEAGFTSALVSELDNDARDTYIRNRKHLLGERPFGSLDELHFSDVATLDKPAIERARAVISNAYGFERNFEVDLIVGGPPCQGYSGIGHRRSYAVEKRQLPSNRLFEPMAELIEQVRPKAFLFENVKGILSGRWSADGGKGEIWRDVRQRFQAIDWYSTNWQLVQAKDYNVPQNRPRVLLVGIREDIAISAGLEAGHGDGTAIKSGHLPDALENAAPDLVDLLSDLVDPSIEEVLKTQAFPKQFHNNTYAFEPMTDIQRRLRTQPDGSLLRKGDTLTEQEYSKHKEAVVAKFQFMISHGGQIAQEHQTKKFAQRLLPARWGNKGPTITATSLPDDYVHYLQPRILTVREWARLQTFPDWYQFSGKRTTGGTRRAGIPTKGIFDRELPKYTQIGNAVPVNLAKVIGTHLKQLIEKAGG